MAVERPHQLNFRTAGMRQLSLEIRSRRFAFAVFQGAELLDWGARSFPKGKAGLASAIGRLAFLLKMYTPSVVITRNTRRVRDKSAKNAGRVLRRLRGELKRQTIPFVVLARRAVRNQFARFECRTKHDIAAAIADRFGQLKSRLPPIRKPWDPERNIVAVFDAVATGFAFSLGRDSTTEP